MPSQYCIYMQRQNSLGDKSEDPEMKKKPACGRKEKSQGLGMNVSEALEQRLSIVKGN